MDFPFKLSPEEYDLIKLAPNPPSSIILLGRSGTGKTTCAVYRLWGNWLRHYTNPGLDPVHAIFVTASATLRERVALAFRRLQSAVLPQAEFARVEAAASATYHTLRDVPSEAFPLFLSSRTFLRMLDGSTGRTFFPRQPNGAILQVCADVCVSGHVCWDGPGGVALVSMWWILIPQIPAIPIWKGPTAICML